MNIGDWVVSDDSPGIWRVFRIERDFMEFRWSLTAAKVRSKNVLVFAQRVLGSTWKKSFTSRVFEESLVHPLPVDMQQRLHQRLAQDPGLSNAIDQSKPESVDLVVNLRFGPIEGGANTVAVECERLLGPRIDKGMILDEVLALLATSTIDAWRSKNPTVATLQLVAPGHLRRGDEFALSTFRVLTF
jgi:hypothetical protein